MTYLSSTTTSPNVPHMVTQAIAGPRHWIYSSTDVIDTVQTVNYFTDGQELGFKVGDSFLVINSSSYATHGASIVAVGSTICNISTGVLLSDGSTAD